VETQNFVITLLSVKAFSTTSGLEARIYNEESMSEDIEEKED
jgi:hypothetical protein